MKTITSLTPAMLADSAAVRVESLGPQGRISLRARGDLSALNGALGLDLPTRIGHRASTEGMEALCLGPDEWVLVLAHDRVDAMLAALGAVYDAHPHSATAISGREVSLLIDGPRAAELLAIACPRDIATIAEGAGRRTVFDGASVVIWHDAPGRFRMDVWNSFAAFVAQTLITGARELAAEPVEGG